MSASEYNATVAALKQLEDALTRLERGARYMAEAGLDNTAMLIQDQAVAIKSIIKRTERGLETL